MRHAGASGITAIVAACALSLAAPARAGEPTNEERAEKLFLEGRALVAQNDHVAACAAFDESYKLDPTAVGTLMNLALCRARFQKYATAVNLFRAAVSRSRGLRDDRIRVAEEYLREFEPKVSTIVLLVDPNDAPRITITLDGTPVTRERFGVSIPLDGAEYTIEASVPGQPPWRTTVKLANESATLRIEIPPFAIEDPDAKTKGRRTLGYVIGAVGVAGLVTGAAVGFTIVAECGGFFRKTCKALDNAQGTEIDHTRKQLDTRATVTDIALVVGGVALAAGTFLVLTSRAPRAPALEKTAGRLHVYGFATPAAGKVMLDVAF